MKTSLIIFFSALLMGLFTQVQAQNDEVEKLYQEALFQMEALGNFPAAIEKFEKLVAEFPQNKPLASRALLMVGRCHEKLGRVEAKNAYNRIIDQYGDQLEVVTEARARLLALAEETPGFTIRKVGPVLGDGFGKVSPDGRYRTFVDWNTGDLAIEDLTTGEQRRLTNKGSWLVSDAMAFHSRWSPDGKHIVFDWWDWGEPSFVGVRIVEPDGTNLRDLFRVKDPENTVSITYDWSPDGKDILAVIWEEQGLGKIILISVSDGSMTTLKEFDFKRFRSNEINNMRFSPCGEYVIYDFPAEESPNMDIYILSLEEKSESHVVEHPANDLLLEWTPDGKNVLFLSDRRGTLDIWRLPMDEGKAAGVPELVKEGIGQIDSQGLTTGGAFYYVTDKNAWNVYLTSLDSESGKIIEPPMLPMKYVGTSTHSPAYSPDGKYLAYVSERGPAGNERSVISIRSLETGKDRKLFPEYNFERLKWSSDNRFLLAVARDTKDRRAHDMIAKIDVETEEVFRVFRCEQGRSQHRAEQAVWSNDGRTIFYVFADINKRSSLVSRDLNSGRETELYRVSEWDIEDKKIMGSSLSRSPDGNWLAFITGYLERNIKIIPSSGGEPRDLYSFKQPDHMATPTAWSSDGNYILFGKYKVPEESHGGMAELWRIAVDGGEPQKLDLTMFRLGSLSMHPNGKHLAFSSLGHELVDAELWVIENFLPEE